MWEQEFIQVMPAGGSGYRGLVASNLPPVPGSWSLAVITCHYAQNWDFNGGGQKIFQSQLCVSIFHSANAIYVGGRCRPGEKCPAVMFCDTSTVTPATNCDPVDKMIVLDMASYKWNCMHPCLWHTGFNTYMCVICTQSNLWPGTVYTLKYLYLH